MSEPSSESKSMWQVEQPSEQVSRRRQWQMIGLIDPDNIGRFQATLAAKRRPAAILCADLEGSTPLSSKMSTANPFASRDDSSVLAHSKHPVPTYGDGGRTPPRDPPIRHGPAARDADFRRDFASDRFRWERLSVA